MVEKVEDSKVKTTTVFLSGVVATVARGPAVYPLLPGLKHGSKAEKDTAAETQVGGAIRGVGVDIFLYIYFFG